MEQSKREISILHERNEQFKKERLFGKGLKRTAKMRKLSQNELNHVAEMHNQSQDELERIAKIRKIKNYDEMSKEELIISLLKSKQSIAEISDIKRIINRLRDIYPKNIERELKKTFMK